MSHRSSSQPIPSASDKPGLGDPHSSEDRDTHLTDTTLATTEEGSDSRDVTRLSVALGASYRLWDDGSDALSTYASYYLNPARSYAGTVAYRFQ